MKKFTLFIFLLSFLSVTDASFGQTPSDDLMMKQRWSCWAIGYDQGKFDHYWEGTNLRVNGTIASVTRTTVTPMVAIGLHDKLNLLIMTPYVQTRSSEPNGGKLQGVKGFQDVSLFLKRPNPRPANRQRQAGSTGYSGLCNTHHQLPLRLPAVQPRAGHSGGQLSRNFSVPFGFGCVRTGIGRLLMARPNRSGKRYLL